MLLALTHSPTAIASILIENDTFLNASYNSQSIGYLRNRLAIGVGTKSLGVHGVGYYESLHGTVTDILLGGGLRVGFKLSLSLEGGMVKRMFAQGDTLWEGTGAFGTLRLGYQVSKHLGLSFLIIGKSFPKGDLPKRTTVDAIPFLSIGIMI